MFDVIVDQHLLRYHEVYSIDQQKNSLILYSNSIFEN